MSLSNMNKDVTTRLFQMLSINDNENNKLESIKNNYSQYAQLKLIAEQIYNLQNQAHTIIKNAEMNNSLHKIDMQAKKVPGTYYYHYLIDKKEVLSIISPDEWSTYTEFYGKYYYDYDNIFYQC